MRIDAKPRACRGCGYCCKKAPCELALRVYGAIDKCPALTWDGSRYWCKIIKDPVIGYKHKEELAIGAGCCSSLNTDRNNIKPPVEEVKMAYTLSADAQALITAMANDMFASPDALWLTLRRAEDLLGKSGKGLFSHAWALAKQQRQYVADKMMGKMESSEF